MKTLFSVAAGLTMALGIAWLFLPQAMLSAWGVQAADEITVYVARRYGGLFFGYAVILWMARASPSSTARTAILAGGAIVTTVLAIVSLAGALTGIVGPFMWSTVAIEVLLAGAFIYYSVTAR